MGYNGNENNYFQGSMTMPGGGGGSAKVIRDLSSESDHGPFAFRAGKDYKELTQQFRDSSHNFRLMKN